MKLATSVSIKSRDQRVLQADGTYVKLQDTKSRARVTMADAVVGSLQKRLMDALCLCRQRCPPMAGTNGKSKLCLRPLTLPSNVLITRP